MDFSVCFDVSVFLVFVFHVLFKSVLISVNLDRTIPNLMQIGTDLMYRRPRMTLASVSSFMLNFYEKSIPLDKVHIFCEHVYY